MRRICGEHFLNRTGEYLEPGVYLAEQKYPDPLVRDAEKVCHYIVTISGERPFLTVDKMLYWPSLKVPSDEASGYNPFRFVDLNPSGVTIVKRVTL